jgi:cytidylate kinase
MLAEKLSTKRYYMGALRRERAKELGMTLKEYNKLGETDPSTDLPIEEYIKKLGNTEDNFIIESRTAYHVLPQSIKIYISVDEQVGVERIWKHLQEKNDRNEADDIRDVNDLLKSVRERRESDVKRYKKYYNMDITIMDNYDIIVDSTNKTKEEVFAETLEKIEEYKKAKGV